MPKLDYADLTNVAQLIDLLGNFYNTAYLAMTGPIYRSDGQLIGELYWDDRGQEYQFEATA
jgi:hypothetical protein